MSILPNTIYRVNEIPIKIPMAFLQKQKKKILKFIWNLKGPQIANTILKKNKVGSVIVPDFITYYKANSLHNEVYSSKGGSLEPKYDQGMFLHLS